MEGACEKIDEGEIVSERIWDGVSLFMETANAVALA